MFGLYKASDGSRQITQVWVDTDGEHVMVNTAQGRQKTKNVRCDPRVAVNVVDPDNAWRLAMVRGRVVEVTTERADRLIDELAKKCLDADSYPFRDPAEVRVTLKILPEKANEVGLGEEWAFGPTNIYLGFGPTHPSPFCLYYSPNVGEETFSEGYLQSRV
jgi:PPOX class probable F420-dependent enzyme